MYTKSFLQSVVLEMLLRGSYALAASPSGVHPELVLQAPPAASVSSVAVSPDGSLVASAAGEGGVRLYGAKTGQMLRVLGDVGDRCVVFSPDGQTLTAAGFHMDKLVTLCDVRTGKIVGRFAGHSQIETCAAAFSPDGKLLASAFTAVAFTPDGATFLECVASVGNTDSEPARLWDSRTGE